MNVTRRSWCFAIAIVAVTATIGACSNKDGDFDNREDLTKEVISCEEAFAKLETCCPGFDPQAGGGCVDRDFQKTDHGCEGYYSQTRAHHLPALSLAESQCVRELDCRAIVTQGICERAQNAPARVTGHYDHEDPHTTSTETHRDINENHSPVCP